MSNGLELAAEQSLWAGIQQQQLHTVAKDEPISTLLLTHTAQ